MNLILLGAPGAGKGTQGALLAKRLGVPKIATGDMLREALRARTPLGLEAKKYMDAGELVPDEVIFGMVGERIAAPDAAPGMIFDGFPRNVAQATRLDEMLSETGRRVDGVVVIDVPTEVIVRRIGGRRTDPETGTAYHLEHNPPPDSLAERVLQRPDDREATVRHRLEVYLQVTEPLIAHYRGSGVPVQSVDGDREIEEVQDEILLLLDRPRS